MYDFNDHCFDCPFQQSCFNQNAETFARFADNLSDEQYDVILGLRDDLSLTYDFITCAEYEDSFTDSGIVSIHNVLEETIENGSASHSVKTIQLSLWN